MDRVQRVDPETIDPPGAFHSVPPRSEWPTPQGPWNVGDGPRVQDLLPNGYDAYLRLFHPFLPITPGLPVSWAEMAARAPLVFHGELAWESYPPNLIRDYELWSGHLPEPIETSLVRTLTQELRDAPCGFHYSLAGYHSIGKPLAYQSTIDAWFDVEAAFRVDTHQPSGWVYGPETVWTLDRSLVVHTNYDLTATYIACSNRMAGVLEREPALEISRVMQMSRVGDRSDELNPRLHPDPPPYQVGG